MNDYTFYINLVLWLGILPTHLLAGPVRSRLGHYALLTGALTWALYLLSLGFQSDVALRDMMVALASYSIALFVALSELLMNGVAAWLTRKRGANWTKEIDYVYLIIGAIGLIATVGQLPNVANKVSTPAAFGPFVVTTAIVLRAIKTRAEIGGWNKIRKKQENRHRVSAKRGQG